MKKIISIICFFSILIAAIAVRSDNHDHEHGGCSCGPTQWEMIKEKVFAFYIEGSALIVSAKEIPADEDDEFHGGKTLDGNKNTAWCSRGIGNIIIYYNGIADFSKTYGIEILPGYLKDGKLFKMNNRPKKILVEFFPNCNGYYGFLDYSEENIPSYRQELHLKDQMVSQRFFFDGKAVERIVEYCKSNDCEHNYSPVIRLKILDVYDGSKNDYTCISGVKFLDKKGKPLNYNY